MIEIVDKEAIVKMLREGVVIVKFTKKDGDIRDMKCTLLSSHIPQDKQPKGTTRPIDESVVRVYDVVAEGWRSFVLANVISVETE